MLDVIVCIWLVDLLISVFIFFLILIIPIIFILVLIILNIILPIAAILILILIININSTIVWIRIILNFVAILIPSRIMQGLLATYNKEVFADYYDAILKQLLSTTTAS